ncbi:hypothetical protein [Streptomyces silvensis]|uniref:Gram-positive cocci surface proteins LPxTG domain-containing protein n=1 Tax=Streptomyces silvensis TaxID=1765722 RepID=A0A0W7X2R3_9ACTN|nr:hypothetical protein [Streptomyces silvensis]KUF17197.1 hypothetical protein AT728_15240 [Streptomyces silvensis]
MRLRSSLAAGVAAAVTLAPAVAGVAAAAGDRPGESGTAAALRPACATAAGNDFPIATRVTGGPATYEPGGGFRHWTLELTNTTDGTCGNVHPVIVLVDGGKTLRPRQIQLEFDDGARRHPVRFERTDRDENVGVLGGGTGAADDGFPGFTVGPGRTVTVHVRLAFTSDAAPDRVVASAAVVRRHTDGDGGTGDGAGDSDWVGTSNDYAFDIVAAAGPPGREPGELAKTGSGLLPGFGATAVLLGGVALVVGSRRLRARRR